MHKQRQFVQCRDCIARVGYIVSELSLGNEGDLLKRAKATADRTVEQYLESNLSTSEIVNVMLKEIRLLSRVEDPYEDIKAREMAHARTVARETRKNVDSDLAGLLGYAALSNSLDYDVEPGEAMASLKGSLEHGVRLFRDDVKLLQEFLAAKPGLVLYLTDNAGEIYFDLPLYEYLIQKCQKVVLVVKGGPALNDITRKELAINGLESHFPEIADTGTAGVGVDWRYASPEFFNLLDKADLILAKGMANWGSLRNQTLSAPVFYLFKVKCSYLRKSMGAPDDSYWAAWQEPGGD